MSEYTDYYQNLLILQYKTQPKARGTVGALVSNGPASAYYIGPKQYTIYGTPTIKDGIATNLYGNYLSLSNFPVVSADWEFRTKASTELNSSNQQRLIRCTDRFMIRCYTYWQYYNGTVTRLGPDNSYNPVNYPYLWLKKQGSTITALLSTDGIRWETVKTGLTLNSNLQDGSLQFSSSTNWWRGWIDLNETYIKVNGKIWFGTIPAENNLTSLVMNGYDIDTAEGNQLDVLGKYIGLNRNVKEKINSPETVILTDEQYRLLLKLKRVSNISYSSTSQIRRALYEIFPNDIRVFDNRTMEMEYQLSTRFNDLVPVIIAEELLPFPMGLGFNVIIVPDLLELYGYYGYDGLNNNPNGYSSYTDGFKGKYLSYGDRT